MSNNTPRADRVHIGIFGRRNSGKSSLINAITGQDVALVSDVPGTTTDPVNKSMELPGVGPVTFIDTAGFDDEGILGAERVERTRRSADRVDVAIVVFADDGSGGPEAEWTEMFRKRKMPVIAALNKSDLLKESATIAAAIEERTGLRPVVVSSRTGDGIDALIGAIADVAQETAGPAQILGNLVQSGDVVMLVMPQDPQAPRGRLILPQAQTIRELLDRECLISACTTDRMESALGSLAAPPKLIVTDSQVFARVSKMAPKESMLTSFSVLFARYKGDIKSFVAGASAIDRLTASSRILIAEACTHAPQEEDIGRVKIPAMLRKRVGEELRVDVAGGSDFPEDLSPYDLIIHCGACMFNRRHVLSRIARAEAQGIPITNYGIAIAYLTGILDDVVYPD